MRKSIQTFILVLVALFLVVLGGLALTARMQPGQRSAPADRNAASSAQRAPSQPPSDAPDAADPGTVVTTSLFRNIAKRQNAVVVAITTQSRIETPRSPFPDDEFFRRFFGGAPPPRAQQREALGSGFIISPDGEILTNNHVVAGADQIRVALFNDERRTYAATVEGRDPLTDSALIKLTDGPGNLPTAVLGSSDPPQPGDWVMAIGNPFQLGHTVTVGVISYRGRPFATTEGRFQDMLQTDASINPGNSGGPLLNVRGEVIGINTAILSGEGAGGGNIGIGFAVPIETVKDLLPQLRKGNVERGQLGVQILSAPITDADAKSLGLPKPAGAIISRVDADSPAERAGLQPGDVIVEFNGQPIADADQLTKLVVSTAGGTRVPIVYYRNGSRQTATATVDRLTLEDDGSAPSAGGGGRRSAPGFGLTLQDITPDIARQLGLPAGVSGALVENVEAFTPASNAGLRRGDVILEVNRQAVHSAREVSDALRSIGSGEPAFLLIWRDGTRMFIPLRKE
jgi:serine protease Do